MKKFLLLFAIFCGLIANSSALTFVVGGVNYNVVSAVSPFTVEVIAKTPIYTGAVTIPAQVINGATTYSVVRIGQQAFQNCVDLTSVSMPNSVTDINLSAFAGCTALTNVVFSTALVNIRGYAFTGCSSLAQINFPANLLVIDNYAFRGCSSLTTVTIPAMVATMGVATFAKCTKLTSFNVSTSNFYFKSGNGAILSKDGSTLVQCPTGVASFEIPTSVTTLINLSLSESATLETVFIPSSVTSIGESVFSNCSVLDSIYCNASTPPTVANANAFLNVPTNAAIFVPSATVNTYKAATHWKAFANITATATPTNFVYNGIKYSVLVAAPTTIEVVANTTKYKGDIVIPAQASFNYQTYSVTQIGIQAFNSCTELTSITMPNSITTIGKEGFSSCNGLKGALTIPSSVTSIGEWAFYNCSGLTGSLTIPSSVTSIGYSAFKNCSGFTGSLTIPSSLTKIEQHAFNGCSGLTGALTIPSSITTIGQGAFEWCSGFTSLNIPSSATTLGNYAFRGCSGFTGSLTIPSAATTIGNGTFDNCNGLTGLLIIPSSVTSIGDDAFNRCSGFTGSLTIPSLVTSIGKYAFYGCRGFSGSLTIPSSVTTIGEYAFTNCSGFNGSLTIPSTVTSIGEKAFEYCTALTSIYSYTTTPIDISASANVFNGVNKTTCILYVPANSKALYAAANQWKDFININPSLTSVSEQIANDVLISISISSVLKIDNLEHGSEVELYNSNGALLMKQKSENTMLEFNVESLSKGLYVVRVTLNGQAKSFKIIKD